MKTSERCKDFIKSYEKCRLTAYDDGVGVWTIGWGHTKGVKPGDTCTQEQANAWFDGEIAEFEGAVNGAVAVPITQIQFDALVSFAYNVGTGALGSSTLLKTLNGGNYAGTGRHFESWDKGVVNGRLVSLEGLTKRRKAERKIFEYGIYEMHN